MIAAIPAHTVVPGDTLSQIAYSHHVSLSSVEAANPQIRDPDLIYPGDRIVFTGGQAKAGGGDHDADDGYLSSYTPKHAKASAVPPSHPANLGSYSYSGLESLWIAAGGNPGSAPTAACIAGFESGGNPNATGAAGERGLWQIHPAWGALSTYSPSGNAAAAVRISGNGSNWSPWSTHAKCGV